MASGPSVVLVTSLRRRDAAAIEIEMLAVDSSGRLWLKRRSCRVNVNGAGDMTAALFFAHWRQSGSIADRPGADDRCGVRGARSHRGRGAREIQLIRAQESMRQSVFADSRPCESGVERVPTRGVDARWARRSTAERETTIKRRVDPEYDCNRCNEQRG